MTRRSSSVVPPHVPSVTPFSRAPGQALDLRRAEEADRFRLFDLAQRGPGRADREEQVRIGVAAGGFAAPVPVYGHRGGPWRLRSADDAQGEPRRAAALHQPGDLMPVDAVGIDLGQWPGQAQTLELRDAPVVYGRLVAAYCIVAGDRRFHRSSSQNSHQPRLLSRAF